MVSFTRRLLYPHRKFSGNHWIYPDECQKGESNRCSARSLLRYWLLYPRPCLNKLQANKWTGQPQTPAPSAQTPIRCEMIPRACLVMTGNHLRLSMPAQFSSRPRFSSVSSNRSVHFPCFVNGQHPESDLSRFQFCVSVHHLMINENTSLMQLISIYFTYNRSLHVSGKTLPIIRRTWNCA